MREGLYICQHCPLGRNYKCHPLLTPESVRADKDTNTVRIIPLKGKLEYVNCRHFSCDLGLEQAGKALQRERGTIFKVNYIDLSTEIVTAAPFGTRNHKPKSMEGRIVDENGKIFSYQNGEFYETGQEIIREP